MLLGMSSARYAEQAIPPLLNWDKPRKVRPYQDYDPFQQLALMRAPLGWRKDSCTLGGSCAT